MNAISERQAAICHMFNVEDLIETGHPVRTIKRTVDRALVDI